MKFNKLDDYIEPVIIAIFGAIILAIAGAGLYITATAPDPHVPYPQGFIIMAPQPQNQPSQPLASVIDQGLGLPDKPKISFFRTMPFAILLMALAMIAACSLHSEQPGTLLIFALIISAVLLPVNYWDYRQITQKYDLPSKKVLVQTTAQSLVVPIKDVTMLSDGQINLRTPSGNLTTPFTKIILKDNAAK